MALPTVNSTDTFEEWRVKQNQLKDNVYDKNANFSDITAEQAEQCCYNIGIEAIVVDNLHLFFAAFPKRHMLEED